VALRNATRPTALLLSRQNISYAPKGHSEAAPDAAGLDAINISVDAAGKEVFESTRLNLSYDDVIENIETLVKAVRQVLPDASILVHRMMSNEPGVMMPQFGRSVAHDEGVALVRAYIESMPVTKAPAPGR
jgi:hypothetical protein